MSTSPRKIRWGVLGYARIARNSLIPAFQRSSNSEFHALASRDPSRLDDARSRFGVKRTYPAYEDLLRDPEVDAVYVPLPNSLHREWTIRAAGHGKHVLCEKPLGLTAAEGREMAAACAARGVTLMEAFMYRYTDRIRQVRDVLRSGVLGEIKFVTATFRFLLGDRASIKLRPELGGGALYDVGCYPVNLIGMTADLAAGAAPGTVRPDAVSAQGVSAGGVDLSFSGLLRYSSGLVGSLHCGFDTQFRTGAEIVGTGGALEVPHPFHDDAGSLTLITGDDRREIPVAAGDRYRGEVDDFADAVRRDRPPQFGIDETLRNLEVIDRLLAAAR